MSHWDVIILGAGASGLMCSATAGYQDKSVLVIDHAPKAAAKIRISGGGKCNFSNMDVMPKHYICQNPHFVKSALSRYPSFAFVDLVERHGLAFETRELGKLFCLEKAS
ncbi:MAG: FAD-binding protein, partial [Gammaproteobacteria bacterium]|nr:FAD-binding protein [Gammaproteobacteria bacterium]